MAPEVILVRSRGVPSGGGCAAVTPATDPPSTTPPNPHLFRTRFSALVSGPFEDSLEDALTGQEESDRYDRPLMKTLEQLGRLFHYGINRIDIINGRTLSVDRRAIELIKSLRTRMQDKKMKILGTMEQVEPSNRTFVFQSEVGQRFLGIASTDASGEASLLVLGSRSFSPQGEPGGGCLGGVPPVRPRPPATDNPGDEEYAEQNRRTRSGASDLRARPGAHPAERHRLGTPGDDAPCTSSASGVGELFGPDVLVLLARSDSPAVGRGADE